MNFLANYDSSTDSQLIKNYQEIKNDYGEIAKRVNYKVYRERVVDAPTESTTEFIENFREIIDLFKSLNNIEQKNITNLAWFILYCNKRLPTPNDHSCWRRYSKLMERIKCLPNSQ
jgi:hypothetical protein